LFLLMGHFATPEAVIKRRKCLNWEKLLEIKLYIPVLRR